MRHRVKFLSVLALVGVFGLLSLPAAAEPTSVLEGTVTPEAVAAGGSLTVTYTAGGEAGACDDYGPDLVVDSALANLPTRSYSNRPLVFGLFPQNVVLNQRNYPDAWYSDGTPLADLGFVTSAGILPTSEYPDTAPALFESLSGWQGTFTGTVTVPADLPNGTYNAVWGCGFPVQQGESLSYDTGSPAIAGVVQVGAPLPDGIALTLDFSAGSNIRNGDAQVPVSGSNLLPGAPYTVVLRSDPVQIGAGFVGPAGTFSASYPIPPNTPAGSHSVTVTSLNTAGEEVSAVAYFLLDENGTVLGVSYDGPLVPRFTG
ncbi:MAG: hypothetical protein FGM58_05005 [Acidimicrobiia bacterium]|nr:hypothetical protein [Acidimicrobiia bacterium]